MRNKAKSKAIFWDYKPNNINLKNQKTKIWFLSRKLRFGDLSGITKNDLKKHLSKLEINSSLKELLANYIYARH